MTEYTTTKTMSKTAPFEKSSNTLPEMEVVEMDEVGIQCEIIDSAMIQRLSKIESAVEASRFESSSKT